MVITMSSAHASVSSSTDRRSERPVRHRPARSGWGGFRRIERGSPMLPKPTPASGYSRYVGRVGALAVALGIGAAMASVPGVAAADATGPVGSGGSTADAGSNSSSSGSATVSSSPDSDGDASADGEETGASNADQGVAPGEADGVVDEAELDVDEDEAADENLDPDEVLDADKVEDGASDADEALDADEDSASGTDEDIDADSAGSSGRAGTSGFGSVDKVDAAPVEEPSAGEQDVLSALVAESPVSVEDDVPASASGSASSSGGASSVVLSTPPDDNVDAPVIETATPVTKSTNPLSRFGSLLSSWLGLDRQASGDGPVAPAVAPLMWGAAAVARREVGASATAAPNATTDAFRLFGDGTAENPNAGMLFGNGFSWDATTCTGTTACHGGNAGFFGGDGGNGWNGGNGGSAGLFGRGGNGGEGVPGVNGGKGGSGGKGGLFGAKGQPGTDVPTATTPTTPTTLPTLVTTIPAYPTSDFHAVLSSYESNFFFLKDSSGATALTNLSVDPSTFTQILDQPVPAGFSTGGASLTPDGRWLYTTDTGSGTVSVFNTSGGAPRLDAEIPVAFGPGEIVASPDGASIYVASSGAGITTISVIDTATKSVVGDPITISQAPSRLIVNPVTAHLYVLDEYAGQVAIVDTRAQTVTGTVQVGSAFGDAVISPDGKSLYLANRLPDAISKGPISVVDTDRATVAAPITFDGYPASIATRIAISPNGEQLYATGNDALFRVIDTTTNKVSSQARFVGGGYPEFVIPSADESRVFVVVPGGTSENLLFTFDTATNTFVGNTEFDWSSGAVPLGSGGGVITSATLTPDNTTLYVTSPRVPSHLPGGGPSLVAVVDTGLPAQSLPAPPTTTAETLLSRIPRQTDTIYAEKIQDENGKSRMIVYMSGIEFGFNGSTGAAFDNNVWGELIDEVGDFIDAAYRVFGGERGEIEEIALVGHSNGGMQMQSYAAEGTYKDEVTSVIVFGSPLIKRTNEFSSDALAFINQNDPVPYSTHLDVTWDTDINGLKGTYFYTSAAPVPPLGTYPLDFKYHHAPSYAPVAAKFDADNKLSSAPVGYQMLLADINRFSGTRELGTYAKNLTELAEI